MAGSMVGRKLDMHMMTVYRAEADRYVHCTDLAAPP